MKKKIQSLLTTIAIISVVAAAEYVPAFANLLAQILQVAFCIAVFLFAWAVIHFLFFSEKESNIDDCIR